MLLSESMSNKYSEVLEEIGGLTEQSLAVLEAIDAGWLNSHLSDQTIIASGLELDLARNIMTIVKKLSSTKGTK